MSATNYKSALDAWGRSKLIEQALTEAEWNRRFESRSVRWTNRNRDEALAEIRASDEFAATIEMIAAGPVSVLTDFERGYGCCGPMAESASAEIVVSGSGYRVTFDFEDFDITKFIADVVEAGGGTITN